MLAGLLKTARACQCDRIGLTVSEGAAYEPATLGFSFGF